MGTTLIDNFAYKGKRFLDSRQGVATIAELKAVPETSIPDGFRAYCAEDSQWYQYGVENAVDATTGKWRKITTEVAQTTGDREDIPMSQKAVTDEIKLLKEKGTSTDKTLAGLNSNYIKVESINGITLENFGTVNDDEYSISRTVNCDVYTTVAFNKGNSYYLKFPSNTYRIYVKFRIDCEDEITAHISYNHNTAGSGVTYKSLYSGKEYNICIGDFKDNGNNGALSIIFGGFQRNGTSIMTKIPITFTLYGVYIVPIDTIETLDLKLEKHLNYTSNVTIIAKNQNQIDGVIDNLSKIEQQNVEFENSLNSLCQRYIELRSVNDITVSDYGTIDADEQCVSETKDINVYSAIYFNYKKNNSDLLILPNKKYRVYAKIGFNCNGSSEINAQFAFSHNTVTQQLKCEKRLYNGEIYYLYLGEYSVSNGAFGISNFSIGSLKNGTQSLTTLMSVTANLYGVYIIPEDYFDIIPNDIEYLLDYTNPVTYLPKNCGSALFSVNSLHSDKADKADIATLSESTNKYKTQLENKVCSMYGDSLVTYIGWRNLLTYLSAKGGMTGQGGGQVCNNLPTIKQGFCTIERIALLPKDMRLLVIYCGANDTVKSKIDGIYQIDPALLGSIKDKPLEIPDMFIHRVTNANVSSTDTPGRVKTFYQGYKTLLRNVMALFPKCNIICVTQHKYYNYILPNGTTSDDLVLTMGSAEKVDAIRECAEEFGVPICDLWKTCGVNDYNRRTMLVDSAGVAVHPQTYLSKREESLILNTILRHADLFDCGTPSVNTRDKMYAEIRQWLVDLRNEGETNVMTLADAVPLFISHCSENSIELKNNMYLVFYSSQYGESSGYHLINKDAPAEISSWEKWDIQTIIDPNE